MPFIFPLFKVLYSTHQLSVSPWEFSIKTQPLFLCLKPSSRCLSLSLSISHLLVCLSLWHSFTEKKNICHRIPFPEAMKEVLLTPRNQALQCLANGSPSKSVCSAEPWIWTYALCPVLPTAHQNMMYPEKYNFQLIGWFSLECCSEKMFQPKSFKEKYNDGSLCF